MNQSTLVATVVQQVLEKLNGPSGASSSGDSGAGSGGGKSFSVPTGSFGVFSSVDDAVDAATASQKQLVEQGLETRRSIVKILKETAEANAKEWGRVELEETKIGRLDHKVAKLELLGTVPGVEFLETVAHSGDEGVSIDEYAPWGVVGAITPATHSIPTLTANGISMISAGNALIINPHPSAANCAAMAVRTYNQLIAAKHGIENLIGIINPPTLRSAEEIFKHDRIPLLVVTGGPAVARAALKQPKRAIVAGPGNPPVVVDETADLKRASESIIAGAAFDNNLLCIGEKEVFVVDSVFDRMMDAMAAAGAVRLNSAQVDRLTQAAFEWKDDHYAVSKDLVGRSTSELAQAAGTTVDPSVDLLYGETTEDNPFVPEEQMMPFVPFVRVRDIDEAIALAVKYEHGFGHTAIIHSNNLERITRMGKAVNTTIFVVNGPCTAGLGVGGEGYPSYSIATPTGEGITNPLTFTRFRRMGVSGALRMI